MSRKKLSELTQTDGKLRTEEEQESHEIKSLDQLWGNTGFSKYQTYDLDEYKSQLEEMNTAELKRHAVEVAHVIPHLSRERLEKRLVLEFQKHVANYRTPKVSQIKDKKPNKEALKIMSEVK